MSEIKCPKCKAVLNPGERVILAAKNKEGNWGLLLLSSLIGDYSVINHDSFQVNEGDTVQLHCPACHVELSNYAPSEQLAGIELNEGEQKSAIIISSVAGENCTYKVVDGEIKAFGKDAEKYDFTYESLIAWL